MPASPAQREARCPRCGKRFLYTTIAEHKSFPFCSERCRDIDLGNWLNEKYAIPGPPLVPPKEEPEASQESGGSDRA